MATQTAENYIKAIYQLSEQEGPTISTSSLSAKLKTTSASVTDMLRKLAELELIVYKKYQGVQLTGSGRTLALEVLRKHRLWETFLQVKLKISWDQVHEIAEQLEHVNGPGLIEKLEVYLGSPRFDPHGEPIPDARGRFMLRNQVLMNTLDQGDAASIVAVKMHDPEFLQYLDSIGLTIDSHIKVLEKMNYESSMKILRPDGVEIMISAKTALNIYVSKHAL